MRVGLLPLLLPLLLLLLLRAVKAERKCNQFETEAKRAKAARVASANTLRGVARTEGERRRAAEAELRLARQQVKDLQKQLRDQVQYSVLALVVRCCGCVGVVAVVRDSHEELPSRLVCFSLRL